MGESAVCEKIQTFRVTSHRVLRTYLSKNKREERYTKTKLTEIKFKSAIGVARQLFSRAACLGTLILICSSALAQSGFPLVRTEPATFIASFSAKLNGSLNPHGLPTTFHFQYGTTTSYGLTTPPRTRTGNRVENVITPISSLTANATYHF